MTTQNVILYLLDQNVVFTGTKSYTKPIDYVWASDPDTSVQVTNLTSSTNGTSSFVIEKKYTAPTTLDTITVIVRFSDNTFTGVFYNVNVRSVLFSPPGPQLVILNNSHTPASPRTVTFRFRVPPGVVSVALVSSVIYIGSSTTPVPYVAPTITTVPTYVVVTQVMGEPSINLIQADVTITDPIIGTISRRVLLTIRAVSTGGCRIGGHDAVPFVFALTNKTPAEELGIVTAFPSWYQEQVRAILSESNVSALTDSIPLASTVYYDLTTPDVADLLGAKLSTFNLIRADRSGEFFKFYLENRSDYPLRMALARQVDADQMSVRNDIPAAKIFGFAEDFYESSVDPTTGFETISAEGPMISVVPPMISLECLAFANQQEGIIRQAESVRLYTFIMNKDTNDYTSFTSPISYPKRTLPPSYERYKSLTFRFLCNRQHEIANAPTGDIPVDFVKPYFITLKLEFRSSENASSVLASSLITLYGTESVKTVTLDTPISGVASIEVVEASLPKIVQPAVDPSRSVFTGYIVDLST